MISAALAMAAPILIKIFAGSAPVKNDEIAPAKLMIMPAVPRSLKKIILSSVSFL